MLDDRREPGSSRAWPTPSRPARTARRPSGAPGRPGRGAPRGERDHRPRPEGRPRRRATRTSPRPARSSSGCATRPRPTSRPRSDRALADLRAQVADLALAGRRPGRGRDDDRRPPAPPRRGVPGHEPARRAGRVRLAADGPPVHGRPPLRRGRLRARRPRRRRRRLAAPTWTAPPASLEDPRVARGLSNPAVAARAARGGRRGRLRRPASAGRSSTSLRLLVQRGRFDDLPRVAAEFRRLDNRRRGIVAAHRHQRRAARAAPRSRPHGARLEQLTGGRDRARPRRSTRASSAGSSSGSATA